MADVHATVRQRHHEDAAPTAPFDSPPCDNRHTSPSIDMRCEPFGGRCRHTGLEKKAAHPSSREVGMRVHGSNADWVGRSSESGRVATSRVIPTIKGGPSTAPSAAGHGAVDLNDEVGTVLDELSVDARDRLARLDLLLVDKALLQDLDGRRHQRRQNSDVVGCGQPCGHADRSTRSALSSCGRLAPHAADHELGDRRGPTSSIGVTSIRSAGGVVLGSSSSLATLRPGVW